MTGGGLTDVWSHARVQRGDHRLHRVLGPVQNRLDHLVACYALKQHTVTAGQHCYFSQDHHNLTSVHGGHTDEPHNDIGNEDTNTPTTFTDQPTRHITEEVPGKTPSIIDVASRPLHAVISAQRSTFRTRLFLRRSKINRTKESFVPQLPNCTVQLCTQWKERRMEPAALNLQHCNTLNDVLPILDVQPSACCGHYYIRLYFIHCDFYVFLYFSALYIPYLFLCCRSWKANFSDLLSTGINKVQLSVWMGE